MLINSYEEYVKYMLKKGFWTNKAYVQPLQDRPKDYPFFLVAYWDDYNGRNYVYEEKIYEEDFNILKDYDLEAWFLNGDNNLFEQIQDAETMDEAVMLALKMYPYPVRYTDMKKAVEKIRSYEI